MADQTEAIQQTDLQQILDLLSEQKESSDNLMDFITQIPDITVEQIKELLKPTEGESKTLQAVEYLTELVESQTEAQQQALQKLDYQSDLLEELLSYK